MGKEVALLAGETRVLLAWDMICSILVEWCKELGNNPVNVPQAFVLIKFSLAWV
jgi:hypothetical protein